VVDVVDLKKSYGNFVALNGVSFHISEGEMYGFVGPNGAGKTTTMKIMSGLLAADGGSVEIDGVDILRHPKKVKQLVGYMPDFFGVYDNLKVSEYMEFFASVYGIYGKEARKRCQEKLDVVHMLEKEDSFVDVLSRGQKQRLCLARCLLYQPKILVMDEPSFGLDPRARYEMKEVLRELMDGGVTMLVSSHILSELSEICTTVGIIEAGKMVVSGTLDEIMTKVNQSNPIVMEVVDGLENAIAFLKEKEDVETISTNEQKVYVGFRGSQKDEALLLQGLLGQGVLISQYGRAENNLESLFMQITEKEE